MAKQKETPDYGIDAPGVVRNLFLAALIAFALWFFIPSVRVGSVKILLAPMMRNISLGCAAGGILMLIYVRWGKFRHRERILSMVPWTGREMVLDVGTGRGLLMIGAAKRLTTGKAVGIDIWSETDLSGNRPEATIRNADLEGVRDKVDIRSEDASAMTFANETFDVVLSNLCLHNIPTKEGREKACREIVRVLKPGGIALISDFIRLSEYASAFRKTGSQAERAGIYVFDTFPPLGILRVKK